MTLSLFILLVSPQQVVITSGHKLDIISAVPWDKVPSSILGCNANSLIKEQESGIVFAGGHIIPLEPGNFVSILPHNWSQYLVTL